MPSEKRARQRTAREARLAAEAKAHKRRRQFRNYTIVAVIAAIIVGVVFLVSNNKNTPAASRSSTTTTAKGATTTTSSSSTTTTTTASAAANATAQAAANKAAVAAGCPASTSTRVNTQKYTAAPPMAVDKTKTYTATVVTTDGSFTIALDASTAPITVNNFVFLADKGYYHCVIFHRVIPTFMDQTGDPTGTGTGGPGYTIADEYPPKATNPSAQYPLGSVAMANNGQPNTGGSQFFIVAGPEGESLPNSYTLFGQVTSGMSVVNAINAEGNPSSSANGVPPDVTQRILSVTIHVS